MRTHFVILLFLAIVAPSSGAFGEEGVTKITIDDYAALKPQFPITSFEGRTGPLAWFMNGRLVEENAGECAITVGNYDGVYLLNLGAGVAYFVPQEFNFEDLGEFTFAQSRTEEVYRFHHPVGYDHGFCGLTSGRSPRKYKDRILELRVSADQISITHSISCRRNFYREDSATSVCRLTRNP